MDALPSSTGIARPITPLRTSEWPRSPRTTRRISGVMAAEWDALHPPDDCTGAPVRLFTDEDPATTIKGMGFKDAAAAERTIALASQDGATYKTYWSIRAMAERARHHPFQTDGMRVALQLFDSWLLDHADHKRAATTVIREERKQRARLAESSANAHALSRCATVQEFNAYAISDRRDCVQRLRLGGAGREFVLPLTSFVSVFGGPAEHGYGTHVCMAARQQRLPSFRCLCGYEGSHLVLVRDAREILGHTFRWQTFELLVQCAGPDSRATLTAIPPSGQTTIRASMQPDGLKYSGATAPPASASPTTAPPPIAPPTTVPPTTAPPITAPAKPLVQERRNAMGRSSSATDERTRAAARKRPLAADGCDLRDLLTKRPIDVEPVDAPASSATAPVAGTASQQPLAASLRTVGHERSICEKLTAAGFPPQLARRAASAYPSDVERAADWIISSGEW